MQAVNFVFPLFLIAGVLLAIPVIIHLFNFRKFKKVFFPDIRFLQEIKEQTNKRSQLKRLLILLSRLLASIALILAFAQPYFSKNGEKVDNAPNAVSIYIDNSFSLGLEEKGVPKLAFAKNKAQDIVESFSEADKFQILSNEFSSEENRFYPKKEALAVLSRVAISPKKREARFILEKQKKLLSTQAGSKPIIAYISDFQKTAFDLNTKSTDTIPKYFIPLAQDNTNNISIDTVSVGAGGIQLQGNNSLGVKLTNYGEDEKQTYITLEVNGQVKSIVNSTVPAKSSKTDSINFTTSQAGIQKMKVYINDYPMSFDDTFYVAAEVVSNYSILLLNQRNANAFLTTVFRPSPLFKTENNNVGSFNPEGLDNYSLVVLNGTTNIPQKLADGLKSFAEHGGSVLVFAPQSANTGNLNTFLQQAAGCSISSFTSEKSDVTSFSRAHPVFSGMFAKIPDNIDLPIANEHFRISSGNLSGSQKLFTFSNGDGFLNAYNVGNGKLYLCASSAEKSASSFPNSYWFLPMMYKMALSQKSGSVHSLVLGEHAQMSFPNRSKTGGEQVYHLTNGTEDIIPAQRSLGNKTVLNIGKNIQQADLYQTYLPGSKDSLPVGINYSRAESDLSFWNTNTLQTKSQLKNTHWLAPNASVGAEVNSLEKGTPLWKVFIIFALLFLLTEILLIRFLK